MRGSHWAIIASISRALNASIQRRRSSTFSSDIHAHLARFHIRVDRAQEVQLLRHRLPPFLGEAFGGSTGLVDLGGRKARDQASHPDEDPSLALSKVTGAASRTTVLNDHGKHNPIAEVADFLKPALQLLVRAKPVLKEAANGRPSLEVVLAASNALPI